MFYCGITQPVSKSSRCRLIFLMVHLPTKTHKHTRLRIHTHGCARHPSPIYGLPRKHEMRENRVIFRNLFYISVMERFMKIRLKTINYFREKAIFQMFYKVTMHLCRVSLQKELIELQYYESFRVVQRGQPITCHESSNPSRPRGERLIKVCEKRVFTWIDRHYRQNSILNSVKKLENCAICLESG